MLLAAALLAAPGGFSFLAVDRHGNAFPVTREKLDAPGDVRVVWRWSEELPPERLPLGRVDEMPRRTPEHVSVAVEVRADAAHADLHLVAAPLRMWQEVPEPLLPRWRVPEKLQLRCAVWPGEPWGMRLVGRDSGSAWTVVEPGRSTVRLTAVPARSALLSVLGPGRVDGARALVYAPDGARRLLARFAANKQGQIELPAWPRDIELTVVVSAEELAPTVLHVKDRPPGSVRLDNGCSLQGSLRTREGEPVVPAGVLLETWVAPGVPISFHRTAEVDASGAFRVRGLPQGEATLTVAAKGKGVVRRSLVLQPGVQDLGQLELEEGRTVRVRVTASDGSPVAAALVSSDTTGAYTDREGVAMLRGVGTGSPLKTVVKAAGFLPREQVFAPPVPEEVTLVLERGLLVRGVIVDGDGNVLTDAEAEIRTGCEKFATTSVPVVGGRFEAVVDPAEPGELVLRSPASLEVTLPLQPGTAGEERDLGAIALPAGAAVTGIVVAAADHTPVAGARVTALRSATTGPLVAAALGNVLSTSTAADGSFRLAGLRPGPNRIEVTAPGYAATSLVVTIGESREHDAGTVELGVGATVVVRTKLPADMAAAVAQIRPAAQSSESSSLTSAVEDGEASLLHVPPGPAALSVVAGGTVVCEKHVRVPDKGVLRVDCPPHLTRVRGTVRMGGAPVGAGVLLFSSGGIPEVPEAIVTTRSATGLRQQQNFLARPRPVAVPTRNDGGFGPHPLPPGRWQVTFHPHGGGSASTPQEVEIADAAEAVVDIHLPGLAVTGVVVDTDGAGVAQARVTATPGGATAVAGVDGRFTLLGLPEGQVTLQARLRDLASEPVTVEVRTGTRVEPVQLRLAQPESKELTVFVTADHGLATAGSLVIVELADRGSRFATAGGDGRAAVPVARPYPRRVRAIAFTGSALALGTWTSWDAAAKDGLRLRLVPAGRIEIHGANAATLRVALEDGEDVTALLRQLGVLQPVPEGLPLVVAPLPPRQYAVSNGVDTRRVDVRSGEACQVSFR